MSGGKTKVLLVDDDRSVLEALAQTLQLEGHSVQPCSSYIEAKDHISPDFPGIVVSDIRMPGRDGFDLLARVRKIDATLPVILLTGEGDIPMAVRGMSDGAFAFLEKPCDRQDLLATVSRAGENRALVLENRLLRRRLQAGDAAARMIIGSSQKMQDLRAQLRAVAMTSTKVLVCGEPGTGTGRVAEAIYALRARPGPLQRVAAAQWQGNQVGDSLKSASGGTLLLEGLHDMPMPTQAQLLSLLPDMHDVHLIATTNDRPQDAVDAGRLNADLFLRFNTARLRVPPLRERTQDIPELFRHFVRLAGDQAGITPPEIPADLPLHLAGQDWPGNTRAVQNVAMRFALGLENPVETGPQNNGLATRVALYERALIIDALQRLDGQASAAARDLGLPRKTFYDKLTKHGIRAEDYRT